MNEENFDADLELDEALDNANDEVEISNEEAPASEIPQAEVDKEFAPAPEPAPAAAAPVHTPQEIRKMSIGHGVKDAAVGGLTLSERALQTKLMLSKEKKITTVIPFQGGEKPGAVKTVNINGYRMEIRKNTPVELPMTVWRLIMKSMKTSMDVKSGHPLNLANAPADRSAAL